MVVALFHGKDFMWMSTSSVLQKESESQHKIDILSASYDLE